jgi:purine-cytosine permease-like protein
MFPGCGTIVHAAAVITSSAVGPLLGTPKMISVRYPLRCWWRHW